MGFEGGSKLEKEPEVNRVELENLTVDIVRSMHFFSPNSLRQVKGCNGIAFETGNIVQYRTHPGDGSYLFNYALRVHPQTKTLFEELEALDSPPPVFAIDIKTTLTDMLNDWKAGIQTGKLGEHMPEIIVTSLLISEAARAVKVIRRGTSMTRRSFLKQAGKGIATYVGLSAVTLGAVAGWFKMGNVHGSMMGNVQDDMFRGEEWLGVADFLLRLRNLVMAEKIHMIAAMMRQEGIPHPRVAAVVGSAHDPGLTDALKLDPAERRQFIHELIKGLEKRDSEAGAERAKEVLDEMRIIYRGDWNKEQDPTKRGWNVSTIQIVR